MLSWIRVAQTPVAKHQTKMDVSFIAVSKNWVLATAFSRSCLELETQCTHSSLSLKLPFPIRETGQVLVIDE